MFPNVIQTIIKLTPILVLYNNDKYRKLCDEILAIYDRDTLTSKEIVKVIVVPNRIVNIVVK